MEKMVSHKFGTLVVINIDANSLNTGDIIITYRPDDDNLLIYQHQGNGYASCYAVKGATTISQYSGVELNHLRAIIDESNHGAYSQRVVKLLDTTRVNERVWKKIPNSFLNSKCWRCY